MEDDDNFYIISEFLGNYITLLELIHTKVKLFNNEQMIALVNNLLLGLKYLHSAGIAHRDIKPENIMVNPKNRNVKFIDFGLACRMESCHIDFTGGTSYYVAPEIIFIHSGRNTTLNVWYKADYWSLGMTILEIFAQNPFILCYAQSIGINPSNESEIYNVLKQFWDTDTIDYFLTTIADAYNDNSDIRELLINLVFPLIKSNPADRILKFYTQMSGKRIIEEYDDLLHL